MTDQKSPRRSVPRIESIRIKNYRALCDLELKPLAPLTALLGPNGSGKSTVFATRAEASALGWAITRKSDPLNPNVGRNYSSRKLPV